MHAATDKAGLGLQEDIVKAMGLTGQLLMGQAVMVKSAEVPPPPPPPPPRHNNGNNSLA